MANSKEAQPKEGFFGDNKAVNGLSLRSWSLGHLWSIWEKFFASKMIVLPMRGSFSLWAPWAFCLGAAAYFFPLHEPPVFLPILVSLFCIVFGFFVHRQGHIHSVWLLFILAIIVAFMAGFGAAQWRSVTRAAPILVGQSKVYKGEGLVLAVDKERGHRARYLIEPQKLGRLKLENLPKRIRLSSFINDAEPGDAVHFTAALQAPPQARFPGAYNFARSAWFQEIGGTGFSYGHLHSQGPKADQKDGFGLGLAKIRRAMALRIRGAVPGQKGAVAAALVTGDRSAISENTAEDLRAAGLAHMLAISGLHMGLVAGLVFGGGAMILAAIPFIGRRFDARKPAALLGLAVAIGYLLLSGSSAPTLRAFVMTAVVFAAVFFDRRALSLRTISLAAFVVVLLSPENVISPGFQMSFAAALALIAFYEWAGNRVRVLPRANGMRPMSWVLRGLAVLAALGLTSLIAGLATGPFAAFYFHRAAVYGLLANVAAMPVFTFIVMPSLLAGTLLDAVGIGAPFFALAGWGLDLIMKIAHTTANFPGALVLIPAASALVHGLIAIGLLFVCLMRQMRRLWGLAIIGVGFVLWTNAPHPDALITKTGGAIRLTVQGQERIIGYGDFSRFEMEQFASALAIAPEHVIHIKKANKIMACDASGCVASLVDGRRVVFNQRLEQLAEDCRFADLVIATETPSERNAAHCSNDKLINASLVTERALLLYLNRPIGIQHIAHTRRPWSAKRQKN